LAVKSDALGFFLGCDHVCMLDIPVLLLTVWLRVEALTVMNIKITVYCYVTMWLRVEALTVMNIKITVYCYMTMWLRVEALTVMNIKITVYCYMTMWLRVEALNVMNIKITVYCYMTMWLRVEAFTVMNVKITVLCCVTMCSLVDMYLHFGGTSSTPKTEQQFPPKCWSFPTKLYSVTSQFIGELVWWQCTFMFYIDKLLWK
jgi:hypothetical protein